MTGRYSGAMPNSQQTRDEFSRRLKQALRQAGVDFRSAVRLARDFNDHYSGKPVSRQAVQNWLNGLSMPGPDKLGQLAVWLHTTPEWLQYGSGKSGAAQGVQDLSAQYRHALDDQELIKRYRKLSDRQQQAIAEIITALASKDTRR
jgi:hypothetical protein